MEHAAASRAMPMSLPNVLTYVRIAAVQALVACLFFLQGDAARWSAFALFVFAGITDWLDGYLARAWEQQSTLGRMLDPIADKILVLAVLVMLIEQGVAPAWMVAAIVVREVLVTGLRQAAIERGVVLAARDLGKLKTWAQAVAAAIAGFAAAGAGSDRVAWWALLVAVVLTWVSGLDYARSAPRLFSRA